MSSVHVYVLLPSELDWQLSSCTASLAKPSSDRLLHVLSNFDMTCKQSHNHMPKHIALDRLSECKIALTLRFSLSRKITSVLLRFVPCKNNTVAQFSKFIYRLPTKLRESNVFAGACQSVRGWGSGQYPRDIPPGTQPHSTHLIL